MAIKKRTYRTRARARALRDFTERKVVHERGGDVLRLENQQMEELQAFLASCSEDEKLLFIKMYVEEVMCLEHRVLRRVGRKSSVGDWLIGGLLVLLMLLLVFSPK
jgi:hypothetical protein